jgi:hypothetical protein
MELTTEMKVRTAARAAWKAWLVCAGFTVFTYLAYLAMNAGWLDSFIGWGLYGEITRAELARATFYYVGAMKLVGLVALMSAAFLSFWWRALKKVET